MITWIGIAIAAAHGQNLPPVSVDRDDVRITASCRVTIAPGMVIADTNGDGVIHIDADGVEVSFEDGAELRGAPAATPWDRLSGIGIRVHGHSGVVIRNARVHGYRVGMQASSVPGLVLDGADLSDNYRQRLKSTPDAEHGSDWLFPHDNDQGQWVAQHGAALYVADSQRVRISNVLVRRGQNGIVLDRVTDGRVFDNDCSFLSGWGLAMWRSSGNTITRNALDFCVRGYSHGVYNRGQDSAGILFFEQCRNNVFAENSATHGGDGFFGFAGKEALGEAPGPAGFDYAAAGCNGNIIANNDFSYAVAHGIELTFSRFNELVGNRLIECGICGIWAGYSSDTLVANNTIERNGQMAYGLERGGVNIEHGSRNRIIGNTFRENACAVHLWWDNDGALLTRPGVQAVGSDVVGNVIARNTFAEDRITLQLRDTDRGHVRENMYIDNTVTRPDKELDVGAGCELITTGTVAPVDLRSYTTFGVRTPVGARRSLSGRANIILDGWGPWDHQRPTMRLRGQTGGEVEFQLFGVQAWDGPESARGTFEYSSSQPGKSFRVSVETAPAATISVHPGTPTALRLKEQGGVWTYRVRLAPDGEPEQEWHGTVVSSPWSVTAFPWTAPDDPREKLDAWRSLAGGPDAVRAEVPSLDFRFGGKGPRDMKWSDEVSTRGPGRDRFGVVATTRIAFPAGRWRVNTLSDDGVRVSVNGRPVIENWTWHAPQSNSGEFESDGSDSTVAVEYFEIDGHAVLSVGFEPVPSP